ncbi:NAD(P)H dehydrogenase [Termitidicoccus mucosus]|uniref:NAD(P)H dehydrogenase n=1 Tax=Termitidicoccus mucosus TaxID=1184151 RepID=A0A178IDJ6_9BACT|nr:NAD(P)H dehydrogenase [Opitutaceae bacterium TSB47]
MQISIILGHPDASSFNHAIAKAAVEELEHRGHTVCFHDLYAERFDPLITKDEFSRDARLPPEIQKHCEELKAADGIIVVHPNWWGQPPAILKGWIDRVVRPGVAYRFQENDSGEGIPVGLLKARHAVIFNTANTPAAREAEVFGDPLERLWKDCVFRFCGISAIQRKTFSVVVTSSLEQRTAWLAEARSILAETFGG